MVLGHNPTIITNGLILFLDTANQKSYPGSGTNWTDLSGNGLNATISNNPTYSTSNNGILTFSAANAGATSTGTSSLYNFGTGDFSVECWIKTNGSGGFGPVFSLDNNLDGTGIIFYATTSTNNFRTWIASSANNSTKIIADNVWHQLVACRASGTVSKYIDGVLDGTYSAVGSVLTNQNAKIGWNYGGGYAYTGSMSKVAVYNRALSATEVLNNFVALRGRFGV